MPDVRLREKRVGVGEESRVLLSGEVHYWRLEPKVWRDALLQLKSIGLNIVSSYVPWEFHELVDGGFDFEGRTEARRDLAGFLSRAAELGIWAIVRPGPYISAEWQNQGVPDRVAHLHRLNPEFQAEAGKWIAAVSMALRPFLATNGGPVVICQADNEIDPCYAWHGSQIGIYEGVKPTDEFTYEYVRTYLGWVADQYRTAGINVPLSTNTYPDFAIQPRAALLKSVDLIGSDFYPTERFAKEPDEHRQFLERIRYLRAASDLPYLAEFGAGVWHGQHYHAGVSGPRHYLHAAASAIVAGAAGWNWYMLVNRDNWYGAPINESARGRGELTEAFRKAIDLFRDIDPPSLEKVTSMAVTFSLADHRDGRLGASCPILKALYESGIDYEFFDPELGRFAKPVLLYSGTGRLSRLAQKALRSYVEGGGWLVLFQTAPLEDQDGSPLNLLELVEHDYVTPGWGVRVEVECGGVRFASDGPIQGFRSPPGKRIAGRRVAVRDPEMQEFDQLLALEAGQELIVGYSRRIGSGGVLHLGIAPTTDALLAVHAELGVAIPVRTSPLGATTALFKRPGGRQIALVVNDGRQPAAAIIHLPDRDIAVEFGSPYALVELD